MGGVTIAHQPTNNEVTNDDAYSTNFPVSMKLDATTQALNDEQFNQLLATSAEWTGNNLPVVEDLTGEVQELMMRESVNTWLQQPWGENAACLSDFDTQMYAQSLQLNDIFGQDFTQDVNAQTAFYDELTFVPDDASLNLSAPTSSSASSPSDSSALVSPVVQPALDTHIDEIDQEVIVEKLQPLAKEEVEIDIEEHHQVAQTDEVDLHSNLLKRRRSSSSSSSSSSGSDSEDDSSSGSSGSSDSEDENIIPTTVANMSSRGRYASSSSDSESENESPVPGRRSRAASPIANPYVYMPKRQIEETLLDRITNSLHPDKLPGILPILSPESSQQEDEVEIDLSCLAREQLIQVLSYVDACILEQNGGPAVNVEHFINKKKTKSSGPRTRPALKTQQQTRRRRPCKPRAKSRAELTEDIDAGSSSDEESSDEEVNYAVPKSNKLPEGPISMASLSKKSSTTTSSSSKSRGIRKPAAKKSRGRRNDDDALVSSSVNVIQDPFSIASSRPKRRAAVHKRRLLEEMLAPSDDEEDEEEVDTPLVVFGDEKMDLGVIDNRTIMHQGPVIASSTEQQVVAVSSVVAEDSEDTDEEIDIMC